MKTKKIWVALLAVFMFFACFSFTSFAKGTVTEGYYTVASSNGGVEIVDCDESISGDIVIPDTIYGYPVVGIGEYAFENCRKITSIVIPNTVRNIGESAFRFCPNLLTITIPNGVTSIESYAISECEMLTSINIPASVSELGECSIAGCWNLQSINVDENNEYYSSVDGVLFNKDKTSLITYPRCIEKTSYEIPNTVVNIERSAFENCENLESVTIPDSVTNIGELVFGSCRNLTSINVDNNPYYSSENGVLFDKNKSVLLQYPRGNVRENYEIPNSVTKIGESAFSEAQYLTSITIPNSVTTIEIAAFCGCPNLTSVVVPDSVTYIGQQAFCYCSELTSITLPNKAIYIEAIAFSDTAYYNNPENWENDMLYIDNHLIDSKIDISGERTIKDGTIDIAESAFSSRSNLESIIMPDSVVLTGTYAFSGCTGLKNVKISNNLEEIADCVFRRSGLESIVIPDGVITIGLDAFYDCTGLESVVISDSVKTIKGMAFSGCTNLKKVNYTGDIVSWCNIDFVEYIHDLSTITIYDGTANPVWYSTALYINDVLLEDLVIPNEVKSIKQYAFTNCDSLTSVTIPTTLERIDKRAFELCDLESIYMLNPNVDIYDDKDTLYSITTIYGYYGSTAEAYAKKYDRKFVPFTTDITDEDTDVNVEFRPEVFPEGTVMLIDKKGQNADGTFNGKYEYYESFDISFVDENNKEVQPDGTVTVRLPVPQTFNPEKTVVYYVAPDGTATKLNSWHEGRYIVFETDHFSEYVIVDESSEIIAPEEPEAPSEPEKPEEGEKSFFEKLIDFLNNLFKFFKSLFD